MNAAIITNKSKKQPPGLTVNPWCNLLTQLILIHGVKQFNNKKVRWVPLLLLILLTGCTNDQFIQKHSDNQNDRITSIVLHYTAVDKATALKLLTQDKYQVSAHFLIDDKGITQLVPLGRRAWHAGVSHWSGRSRLNDTSIGIEIVNETQCQSINSKAYCIYDDFPPKTIENLVKVLAYIQKQYPDIKPQDIIGHSDITPSRKQDPGPLFPWHFLHTQGFGAWYDKQRYFDYVTAMTTSHTQLPDDIVKQALSAYGYYVQADPVAAADAENTLPDIIKAFQMHFTPWHITAEMDYATFAALMALLEKYAPEQAVELNTALALTVPHLSYELE